MIRTVLTLAAEPAERFALIISALLEVVFAEGKTRNFGYFTMLIMLRINRLAKRFVRLATFGQPKYRAPRPKPQSPKSERPNTPPRTRSPVPTYYAWLARLLPRTRLFTGEIELLLAEPEMIEFIANTPSAARILRLLLDMLDITLPKILQRPPKPRWKRPPGHIPKHRINPIFDYQPGPRKDELKALRHAPFLTPRIFRF